MSVRSSRLLPLTCPRARRRAVPCRAVDRREPPRWLVDTVSFHLQTVWLAAGFKAAAVAAAGGHAGPALLPTPPSIQTGHLSAPRRSGGISPSFGGAAHPACTLLAHFTRHEARRAPLGRVSCELEVAASASLSSLREKGAMNGAISATAPCRTGHSLNVWQNETQRHWRGGVGGCRSLFSRWRRGAAGQGTALHGTVEGVSLTQQ